jgi:transcriptional regulator with XRE-family HTH domain
MIGYSVETVKANRQADAKHPGVKLGRLCIKLGIPTVDVATACGVTRVTVYNWFRGEVTPSKAKLAALTALISKLQSK